MSDAYVYRVFDVTGRLLYVGCTKNPKQRMAQHEVSAAWFPFMCDVTWEHYADRWEAQRAEARAIATEHPRWNCMGRSPEHPDGPLSKWDVAPHLADEVEMWEEWRKLRAFQAVIDARRDRLDDRIAAMHGALPIALPRTG